MDDDKKLNLANAVVSFSRNLVADDRARQFATTLAITGKKQPKIWECAEESILAAMMACVHLDLMPNTPEGLAYLIPYKIRDVGWVLQFQVGYRGLIHLAYNSSEIKAISAELVFPEDKFRVELGTERKLTHQPNYEIDRTAIERIVAVYATAKLASGETVFDVLNKEDIAKIRSSSRAKSTDSPWETWGEMMAKKTAVKRLLKYLPSSPKDNRIYLAAQYDSWSEAGKLRLKNGNIEVSEDKVVAGVDLPKPEVATETEPSPELADELAKRLEEEPPKDLKDKIAADPKYQEKATQEDIDQALGVIK